ncbi:MAG: cob(I)yrinic acid a,c-diamide adenosyltransferase [Anaerolineae bacterium]
MSFYTRRGDDGSTGLLGKGRVAKNDARIETLGNLDEASAALGVARASARDQRCGPVLLQAQRDLYLLMAEVASSPENTDQFHFDPARVTWLERQIDELGKTVEMPSEFIVPGDSAGGAALSVARAVVRRAERRLVELLQPERTANEALRQYLNRLSSMLFVLELIENQAAGKPTTKAKE